MIPLRFNITRFTYVWIACLAISLTACDDMVQKYVNTSDYDFFTNYFEKDTKSMEVIDVTFSPDYKTFTVTTKQLSEGPEYQLEDSARVRTEVTETIDGIRHTRRSTPQLVRMRNVEAEGVAEHDVRMLVLVDLTMPQTELNKVRTYVSEIRTVFDKDNLFVAFMDGEKVSKTMPLTEYILNAYFVHSDKPYIFLYRSMQLKREEIMQGRDLWQDTHRRK